MQFSREFYLRSADFDKNERLTPRAILELFQDVAGNHAEQIGMGFNALLNRNLLWVIARTKFVVEKEIERYSTVKVKTWPKVPQRFIFRREYLIYNSKGEIAVRGSADWMVIDSESRSLVSGGDIFPKDADYITEFGLDEKLRKIRDIEGEKTEAQVVTKFTDIDLNGHVNNTRYADFAINAINPDKKAIKSFQIDYHKEVLEGEELRLTATKNEDTYVVKGEDFDGEKKFTCEVIFE